MKKVLLLAAAFVLLFQAVAHAELKIGIVVLPKIVFNSEYGKEMGETLKQKFEPLRLELERQAKELKEMEDEIKNQDLALKLDAKQERERDFRRKLRDFQDSQVAYNQKLQAEQQKLREPIIQKLNTLIVDYARANGYSMILQAAGGVLYAQEGMDITDQITAEFDKLKKKEK